MYIKFRFKALIFFVIFSSAQAQDSSPLEKEETLVEYLTVINLATETKFINDYCGCEDKVDFVANYQNLAKEINKTINKHITKLSTLKTRDAINHFKTINEKTSLKNNWKTVDSLYLVFKDTQCPQRTRGFLPTSVTIAEITGVANSIIGLINEGKKRRDAQRDKLIALLDVHKIPSIQIYMQAYKCGDKKEVEEQE
ncbi:MAG: hypothetical protein RIM83_16965 [Allomuricauda sp.]